MKTVCLWLPGKNTHVVVISPGGMNGVADGDNVSCPAHIQVWPGEGDEPGVRHSVLVPARHIVQESESALVIGDQSFSGSH